MTINFELEIEGAADKNDIVNALEYAAGLVENGYIEGDLRNETIEAGHFTLTKVEKTDEGDQDPI